jgi:cob(I)alamin adenosyltransferase
VPKSKIYTRTGDQGSSSLYNGERRRKSDYVFEALGDLDELNAHIGLAREQCKKDSNKLDEYLEQIQCLLFDFGSYIATPRHSSTAAQLARTEFSAKHVQALEQWIDALDSALPALTTFILPSGGEASARLHIARAVCRRAERAVVALVDDSETALVEEHVIAWINRLADFLFVAARHAARHAGTAECCYKKGNS